MLTRWQVIKFLWNSFKAPCLVGSDQVLSPNDDKESVQSLTYNLNGKGYSLQLTVLKET